MPTDDELLRLIEAYVGATRRYQYGHATLDQIADARAAMIAYIEREYVRRPEIEYPDAG